jgi:hypothetical protein
LEVVVEVDVDEEPLPTAGEHLEGVRHHGPHRLSQERPKHCREKGLF